MRIIAMIIILCSNNINFFINRNTSTKISAVNSIACLNYLTIIPGPQNSFILIDFAIHTVIIRSTKNGPTRRYRHPSTKSVPVLHIISSDLK